MSRAPAVPEKAKQGADPRPRDWGWVEATIWTERMLAALNNGVKGSKWFSLIDKVTRAETLRLAWEKVARNKGAAGVDGQSVEKFAARAADYLSELEAALRNGTYRPQAVKRVEIPKGAGQTRPLGIPAVKDRIVQTALKRVIESIFEREFHDISYGFRLGLGCKDALREIDRLIKEGCAHIHGLERWTPPGGTPQGAVISLLLANIYLHPLDSLMQVKGYRMVRYADDFVILCRTAEEARVALDEVRVWTEENGLTLHPDKTHIGDCRVPG